MFFWCVCVCVLFVWFFLLFVCLFCFFLRQNLMPVARINAMQCHYYLFSRHQDLFWLLFFSLGITHLCYLFSFSLLSGQRPTFPTSCSCLMFSHLCHSVLSCCLNNTVVPSYQTMTSSRHRLSGSNNPFHKGRCLPYSCYFQHWEDSNMLTSEFQFLFETYVFFQTSLSKFQLKLKDSSKAKILKNIPI